MCVCVCMGCVCVCVCVCVCIYVCMCWLLQLPREALVASLPNLMRYLTADSYVVHTYAAHTIERLFMVRNAGVAA